MDFVSRWVGKAWGWATSHWKWLASLAVSALVFTAIVALMPAAVPALATMAVAGFVSGAVGAIVSDLLDRRTPSVKHVLLSGVISTVLAVGSFGLAKWIAPHLPKFFKPATRLILRPAISTVGRPVVTTVTNAVVTITEPIVVSALRTAERSVGQVGADIAREMRRVRDEADTLPSTGTPPPARPTRRPPPRGSTSVGLVGALADTR